MRFFGRHAFAILLKTYTLALASLPRIAINDTFASHSAYNVSVANYTLVENFTNL